MKAALSNFPNFPDIETKWLQIWENQQTINKYLKKNQNAQKRFSFFDGPITANNPMGVHHGWGRTYKDLHQRFHNLLGEKLRFQNGVDSYLLRPAIFGFQRRSLSRYQIG